MNRNNKKILAEEIKKKLNSSKYVAMSDLITHDDRYGDMLTWIWGKKDWKENWISGTNINPGKGNEYQSEHIICGSELEKEDFDEIVSLIEKRNKEKQQIYDQKRSQIKEKLNQTPNLYYRFANNQRISTSYFVYPDKHGRYFNILGVENGREYYLNININHPVLNNFPWEKNGYYLIETNKKIERNDQFGRPWSDGGETNPSNFHKWVEVSDQITITPYEVSDKPEKLDQNDSKEKCATCGYAIVGADCYKVDGKTYHSGCDRNDNQNNSSQPAKKSPDQIEKKVADWLIQYFQENQVKEISLKNDELVIIHNNNNETKRQEQITSDLELKNIQNWLQITGKKSLTYEQLQNNSPQSSAPNSPKKTDYIPWIIGGVLICALLEAVIIVLKTQRKKNKIK